MLGILEKTKLLKLFYAMKNLYKTTVTTQGGRNGHTRSEDGILDMELRKPKSLGGEGGDYSNPEQLFAAGYSACYGSALEHVAKQHKIDLGDYSVTATVKLGQTDSGNLQLSAILDTMLIKLGEPRLDAYIAAATAPGITWGVNTLELDPELRRSLVDAPAPALPRTGSA